ncbi:carboxylic ester hydrolase [Elysia marginata]|uniref:Carboxylic ester hydrolase n=1 Tax=Elysia marginata TaxID=1093978 RepID=A0AAV4F1Z3_9GAST|nr:carboxylic ester hydrolase [Elysia marginata]
MKRQHNGRRETLCRDKQSLEIYKNSTGATVAIGLPESASVQAAESKTHTPSHTKMISFSLSSVALFVVGVAIVSHVTQASLDPVLTTTHGDVIGLEKRVFNKDLQVFYGIPFARPPVGNLRFREPKPAKAWGSPALNGTVKPRACWQSIDTAFDRFEGVEMWNPNTEMSEDCLYLNVWRRTPEAGDSKKTIMVWIFGGGFWSGSAVLDVYDGSQLAARKNVILVTIAYRLGPLGFMYLQNNAQVPGNAGLMDQVMALKWVKANAVNLGGSPDDITIFGESAGAASVGFHMLSPLSSDLFTRAIMQSSSPTSFWAVTDTQKTVERVAELAASVSCPVSLGDQLLSCLRAVDAQLLTDKQWDLVDKWFDVPIGPIVDGSFLPKHPDEMLKDDNIKKTDIIIGVNLNEGIYWDIYGFADELPLQSKGAIGRDPFRNIILEIADNNATLQTELLKVYSREFADANKRRMRIIDAASGDLLFKCSVVDFAHKYTELGGRVFLYSFEENFRSNPWPGWMGVPHGYEIEVVFGAPLTKGSINTQPEKELTKEIMGFWTSFAKTGTPEYQNVDWPVYATNLQDYVKIRAKGTRVARRLRQQACDVWRSHQPA